jgi:hypothetical protein
VFNVSKEGEPERGWEAVGKRQAFLALKMEEVSQTKECRQPLKLEKARKCIFPLEPPERNIFQLTP